MGNQSDIVISGRIVFPPGDRPEETALLVAQVEDVSRADAPSKVIAEQVRQRVTLPRAADRSLPFEIRVPRDSIDARSRYNVRVHVDVSGTRSVTSGDFLSTTASPVTPEHPDVAVEVRRV
jgi:putative lipoprotein